MSSKICVSIDDVSVLAGHPEHKVRIVEALKAEAKRSHDRRQVNDAPL